MVELVIKIPEKEYNAILNNDYITVYACPFLLSEAIKNGALLPEGHGRLIDSKLLDKRLNFVLNHTGGYKKTLVGTGIVIAMAENLDAPAVVEADEGKK